MKRSLFFLFFIWATCVASAFSQVGAPTLSPVHVATALNHLTVLEFHEPVMMAAAGSSDFQIERQEDKVFIKPTKSGASTDLFVWTASRRFAYELETTPEVKNMNVSVDNPLPPAPVAPASSGFSANVEELADMMLTRAFLGAVDIAPANARAPKSQVRVRIQQVFRTKTSIYVHYSIENDGRSAYHVTTPDVFELQAGHSTLSLPSFAHKQLDPRLLENLSDIHCVSLPVPHAEAASEDLAPGESTGGVVAIRQNLSSPSVVQLVFDSQVKATFVL
ncbi:MAG: TrbG/VirB9 family P-type conjugative transfer protein [Acidobacteriia bacterium]|nr:TrbG/VirB9 family P-type conjugative transfer protein [Terriglobia bacterium]